jgi:Domain of unknown function (DUF4365)
VAENAAMSCIRSITDQEGNIFRRVVEGDVGIDAHIEFFRHGEEPTGVALQVKFGESCVHGETSRNFIFRPSEADLRYWQSFTLPVFLVVFRPAKKIAHSLDMKEACASRKFENILAGVTPKNLVLWKSNVFSTNCIRTSRLPSTPARRLC